MAKNKSKTFEYGEVYCDGKDWILHFENKDTNTIQRKSLTNADVHRLMVFNTLSLLGWQFVSQQENTYFVRRKGGVDK